MKTPYVKIVRLADKYSRKGFVDQKKLNKIMNRFYKYKDAPQMKKQQILEGTKHKVELFLEAEDKTGLAYYQYLSHEKNEELSEYRTHETIRRIAKQNLQAGSNVLLRIPPIEADPTKSYEQNLQACKQAYDDAKRNLKYQKILTKLELLGAKLRARESTISDKVNKYKLILVSTGAMLAIDMLTIYWLASAQLMYPIIAIGTIIGASSMGAMVFHIFKNRIEDLAQIAQKVDGIIKREIEKI